MRIKSGSLTADLAAAVAGYAAGPDGLWFLAKGLFPNGDFLPAVRVGDAGSQLAGGLLPSVVASFERELGHRPSQRWQAPWSPLPPTSSPSEAKNKAAP